VTCDEAGEGARAGWGSATGRSSCGWWTSAEGALHSGEGLTSPSLSLALQFSLEGGLEGGYLSATKLLKGTLPDCHWYPIHPLLNLSGNFSHPSGDWYTLKVKFNVRD